MVRERGEAMALMVPDNLMVFTGNANPRLAQAVAHHLNIRLGKAQVSRFSDGDKWLPSWPRLLIGSLRS